MPVSWSGWSKKRHHNLWTKLCNSDHSVILGSKFHFISEILRQRGLASPMFPSFNTHTNHSFTYILVRRYIQGVQGMAMKLARGLMSRAKTRQIVNSCWKTLCAATRGSLTSPRWRPCHHQVQIRHRLI